ncbi:MAG: hypothetical protein E7521_04740 [Ruminococcaceae bacterium]|nr:hypothetical protein [Oscillospiraceae bacterium]
MFYKNLKNPPNKYRPAPFWSWNEKLDISETAAQVREMNDVGIGGYFMHARGGLQTEYMSDEWFDNIKATLREGKKLQMQSWGYDENGWPSGFGSGIVNGLGLKYQQKYLRCEETDQPVNNENTIINLDYNGKNIHFYYEVNPFYVDTLDGEVINEFIRSTHEAYKEKLGDEFTDMAGFFTDEPQISRNGYPWSFILEKEYRKAYGKELTPKLLDLFYQTETSSETKYNYFKLITNLFSENFVNNIYKWCCANGSALTGHMVLEEGLWAQLISNGACMPHYEYMTIPGMDNLGRELNHIECEMQLSSAANQLGKKQILSETFACCGWNVSFEELRWIYEHQMVHGINYLCQHLEGYTLRGIRKRDYPATLFKQQPWWSDYKTFNDMVSRIGMLIAEGEINHEILVLHSADSAWATFDIHSHIYSRKLCDDMVNTMKCLEEHQLQYHLGDATLMERHGKVENGKIIIGTQSYSVVVVPPADCLASNTVKLLKEFKAQGGIIIFTGNIPTMVDGKASNDIIELSKECVVTDLDNLVSKIPESLRKIELSYDGNEPILTAVRRFEEQEMTMYYLMNPCNTTHNFTAKVKGKSASIFNTISGEEESVKFESNGDYINIESSIYGNGSLVLFVYDNAIKTSAIKHSKDLLPISFANNWKVSSDDNALTLDYCDVYFDGELAYKNLPVSDVQEKALAFERKVNTKVVFKCNVKDKAFTKCDLVVETPEIFDITVNGKNIEKTVKGYYFDTSFKVIDIFDYVVEGENEIALTCDFVQSDEVYKNAKNSLIFESEKNKLSYDMEIEAIYLKGDFAVKTDKSFELLDRRALRTDGDFYITAAPKTLNCGEIASQGYPFFAGSMTFKQKVNLTADECKNRSIKFDRLPSSVTKVKVNGKDAGKIMWQPYEVDISDYLIDGENEIEITVTGNLRNLLGPFHLSDGENYWVSPPCFFHESPIWSNGLNKNWTDSYCFVEFGLFF